MSSHKFQEVKRDQNTKKAHTTKKKKQSTRQQLFATKFILPLKSSHKENHTPSKKFTT